MPGKMRKRNRKNPFRKKGRPNGRKKTNNRRVIEKPAGPACNLETK
jgi:hypothetical protein